MHADRSGRYFAGKLAVVASLVLLTASTALVACTTQLTDGRRGTAKSDADGITAAMFTLVVEGMRPTEVLDVLGAPTRRTVGLAEGFAWPEPKDTCWYYPSVDRLREYQLCFVAQRLVTHGSYPLMEGDSG